MSDTKKRNKLLLIALVIISTLFSLTLVEIILSFMGFSYQLYPEKVQFGWPEEKDIIIRYQKDKELYWVPKDYYKKLESFKSNNPAVVFMGCSCTEYGRYDTHFASIISNKHPQKKFTYANFGVGGWSTYQGLQQLRRDVIKVKPKLVTIYYGWNDHWIGFGIEDKYVKDINNSIIYSLQRFRIVQLVTKFFVNVQQDNHKPERVSAEDFHDNLVEMVEIARRNGIIPVLITAPSAHEKGKEPTFLTNRWLRKLDDLVPIHRKYVSIVREVAKAEDVTLCDLAKEFEKLPRDYVFNQCFMSDGIHLIDQGNVVIADMLYKCFDKKGLLKQILE